MDTLTAAVSATAGPALTAWAAVALGCLFVAGLLWFGYAPAGLYPPARARHRKADLDLQVATLLLLPTDTGEIQRIETGARAYARLNRERLTRARRSVARRTQRLLNGVTQ